jgi:hypothetical protein
LNVLCLAGGSGNTIRNHAVFSDTTGICAKYFDEELYMLTQVMVHEATHALPKKPTVDYYFDQIWQHTVEDAYVYSVLFSSAGISE